MRWILVTFFSVVGFALFLFGGRIAVFGAEPAIPPSAANVLEGTVAEGTGTLHDSPAGPPFYAAEVRIQEASSDEHTSGTVHWRGKFGDPSVTLTTANGTERLELPPAERWRMLPSLLEEVSVPSLMRLPIVGGVHIGDRLRPPYRVSVRALRPGTPVIAETNDGRVERLFLGDRASLERERQAREGTRFPIVGLLFVMGLGSLVAAWRVAKHTGSVFGAES